MFTSRLWKYGITFGLVSITEMNLPIRCHKLINLIACQPVIEDCANGIWKNCPAIDFWSLKDCGSVMFFKWAQDKKFYGKSPSNKSVKKIAKLRWANIHTGTLLSKKHASRRVLKTNWKPWRWRNIGACWLFRKS